MARSRIAIVVVIVAVLGSASAAPEPVPADGWLGLVQLASLRLRLQRITPDEQRALRARQAHGEPLRQIYDDQIQRWLDRSVLARFALGMIPVPAQSSLFIDTLQRARASDGSWVYFLPHATPASDAAPCADRAMVVPWWAKQPIAICRTSYAPERPFDEVGYCGGQPEPLRPIAPRAGCGCGPLLLACLPPADEAPALRAQVMRSMIDEVEVTGAEILARGGALDELMTTSRTWQDGLVEFLYARREMLAVLAQQAYSPAVEAQLRARLAKLDVARPGRWVERTGVYAGSGLFLSTPLMATFLGTSRASLAFLLSQFLCTDFPANHVDSEALLEVTRGAHAGVRFEVYESPMRNQASCSGCHAPMDYGAGFLVGLRPPLFGSTPTPKSVEGRLYVNGASDLRGSGRGFGALTKLVVAQPEFPRCAVARMFTYVVGRPPRLTSDDEAQLFERLVQAFERSGRRVDALARAVLLSKPATEPFDLETGAMMSARNANSAGAATVPPRARTLLQSHCTRCHDADHVLDLRTPPAARDVETWAQIRNQVETGRMPPTDEKREQPQIMPPGERQELVSAATELINEAQQAPGLRTRIELTSRDWLYVVREVAQPFLSADELDAIATRRRGLAEGAKQLWTAVDVCRAIAARDAARPAAERYLGSSVGRLDDAQVEALVSKLHALVYRAPPSASALARGRAQYRATEQREPVVALCTSYLTGPRAAAIPLASAGGAP